MECTAKSDYRILCGIFAVFIAIAGAMAADHKRPNPGDIKEFVADPIPKEPADTFKDFKIARKDLDAILKDWIEVSDDHWHHGYSHVGFGDRTGHIVLKDGSRIKWMVKPGSLAWLEFADGKKMYLAETK